MGKKRVVLDTNILISVFGWKGKPRKIFDKVLSGEFELILSQQQINEIRRVLNYPKLKFNEEQKRKFMEIILNVASVIEVSNKLKIIKEDPDDNAIVESAIESGANFIVSGDSHLLKLKKFRKIKILTANEFLEEF